MQYAWLRGTEHDYRRVDTIVKVLDCPKREPSMVRVKFVGGEIRQVSDSMLIPVTECPACHVELTDKTQGTELQMLVFPLCRHCERDAERFNTNVANFESSDF